MSTEASKRRSCLKISRIKRLTLLRTTAQPIFLLAVMPRRADVPVLSRQTTRKPFTAVLCLEFVSWRNSARFLNLASLGNSAVNSNITSAQLLGCNSYRQVLATFCSSALDDQSAIFSGHSHQKAMRTLAGNVTGLKCSFHRCLPLIVFYTGTELLNTPCCRCQCFNCISAFYILN